MSIKWFCLETDLSTKEAIKKKLVDKGFKKEIKLFKKILTFDFEKDSLWMDKEDSLLSGYALFQAEEKNLPRIVVAITKSGVGTFFSLDSNGLPRAIEEDQIKEFKHKVKDKKKEFFIGEPVLIIDGLLKGLSGVVEKKRKLMAKIRIKLPHREVSTWVNMPSLVPEENCKS